MNIDNKGWGLSTMLLMTCVIFIALLTATFFSIRINSMLGNDNNESEDKLQKAINETYYIGKMNEMVDATNSYLKDNNIVLASDKIRIELSALINNDYLSPIKDSITDRYCKGYSLAYLDQSGIKQIKSYLYCDNYVTDGYGE